MRLSTWVIPADRCDALVEGVGPCCPGEPGCHRDRTRCPRPGAIELRVEAARRPGEERRVDVTHGGLL